jgi:hypothetical protein
MYMMQELDDKKEWMPEAASVFPSVCLPTFAGYLNTKIKKPLHSTSSSRPFFHLFFLVHRLVDQDELITS